MYLQHKIDSKEKEMNDLKYLGNAGEELKKLRLGKCSY